MRGIKKEDSRSWGNSNGYKAAQLIRYGQSLVSLWPLCRVWNTTDLLCARHKDTETGREEEECIRPAIGFKSESAVY